jgi:V8-like Glu-specific endopeptidase
MELPLVPPLRRPILARNADATADASITGGLMRSRIALLVAPLLLLSLLPGAATAAGPGAQAQGRAAILAYWTPERLASATPRDMGRPMAPNAKPGGGSGGNSTGSSWAASATDPITRATGKVYFEMGGGAWVCSGAVATDSRSGYSLVLTAGHCVVDADTGEFATMWMFIPAFDLSPTFTCGSTQFGCWTATALVARQEFATAGGFNDQAVRHDWAFAVVAGGGKTANANLQLDATVGGSFALDATAGVGQTMTALGYPAAGKYRGKNLVYCQGPVGTDAGTDDTTYSMACGMTGGSSGGPWLTNASAGFGAKLKSLNSYGYSGVKNMYGPIFNNKTTQSYNAANGATSGDILVGP